MTVALSGEETARKIAGQFSGAVIEASDQAILVKSDSLSEIAKYLKDTPELNFDYLVHISAVDYLDYFELVYQLASLEHNHSLVIKTRCYDRENAAVPSIVSIWRAADFQEREIYDLMGISFTGHPNLKRIVLWDGYKGHPLRKDFL